MNRVKAVVDHEGASPLDIIGHAPDADTAIGAWLNVLTRMMRVPDSKRRAIRDELEEHLRERVRDLVLAGRDEREGVREAIEELGETAHLARRFEAAERPQIRRYLMQLSLLAVAAGAVVIGTAVVSQDSPSSGNLPAVFKQDDLVRAAALKSLTGDTVDFKPELRFIEFIEAVRKTSEFSVLVRQAELEDAGIDADTMVNLDLQQVPLPKALDLWAEELSRHGGPVAWRAADGVIEIGSQEAMDRRETTLVCYDLGEIIMAMINQYHHPYDAAVEDLSTLIMTMVEPENWRENGGHLANLRIVGGMMFIQAPKRMHQQIDWIVQQLRGTAPQKDGANAAGQGKIPILGDLPVIGYNFGRGASPAGTDHHAVQPAVFPQLRTRLADGDVLTVSVFELTTPTQWTTITQKLDAHGMLQVPEIGEIRASGRKLEDVKADIVAKLARVLADPKVEITIEELVSPAIQIAPLPAHQTTR